LLLIFFKEKAGEDNSVEEGESESMMEAKQALLPEPEVEMKEFSLK